MNNNIEYWMLNIESGVERNAKKGRSFDRPDFVNVDEINPSARIPIPKNRY